jgi:AbrB family looped-hinge helix DNA binding protein
MLSEDMFYGAATVGERGQIVIPAEARNELGFHPGDKLLVMRHPVHTGLMIFKLDGVRAFLDEFYGQLQRAEAAIAATEDHGGEVQ